MTAKAMPGVRPQPYLVSHFRRRGLSREGGTPTAAAPNVSWKSLHDLAVERNIQTFHLDVPGYSKPDRPVDQLEDDKGDDDVINEHDRHTVDLIEDLGRIALDQAAGAA